MQIIVKRKGIVMKEKHKMLLLGAAAGLANGLFGSGGGIIAVPMLRSADLETKKAHACSLALTLPLSAVSAIFYSMEHEFDLTGALPLIPFGLAGALLGTFCMKKIPTVWLSRIFGAILIIAGGRNLLT